MDLVFIVLAVIIKYCFARSIDHRIEEFSRINHYELLHIDLSEFASSNILQFKAFDNFYRVELELNEKMNPIHLRHTNENPSESCHYYGRVLNANAPSNAAISMCDRRGIR